LHDFRNVQLVLLRAEYAMGQIKVSVTEPTWTDSEMNPIRFQDVHARQPNWRQGASRGDRTETGPAVVPW
jgi:hypothetical protein